jgi:hypothetical protein
MLLNNQWPSLRLEALTPAILSLFDGDPLKGLMLRQLILLMYLNTFISYN